MQPPVNMERATMQKLLWRSEEPDTEGSPISVQFNPETLRLSFSNQVSGRGQSGGASLQYVGRGTSRLSVELWFDATAEDHAGGEESRFLPDGEAAPDVRYLTLQVLSFIEANHERARGRFIPPGVRFLWGTFKFEGVVESINETLDFFSEDGRPLRANVSLTIAQQKIYLERNAAASANDASSQGANGTNGSVPAGNGANRGNATARNGNGGRGTPAPASERGGDADNPRNADLEFRG